VAFNEFLVCVFWYPMAECL